MIGERMSLLLPSHCVSSLLPAWQRFLSFSPLSFFTWDLSASLISDDGTPVSCLRNLLLISFLSQAASIFSHPVNLFSSQEIPAVDTSYPFFPRAPFVIVRKYSRRRKREEVREKILCCFFRSHEAFFFFSPSARLANTHKKRKTFFGLRKIETRFCGWSVLLCRKQKAWS